MNDEIKPKQSVAETTFLVLAWALIVTLLVWHGLIVPFRSPAVDYGKHWDAAHALAHGQNPYLDEEFSAGFPYPLLTGVLFLHLAAFSREAGETVWEISNFLFTLGGIFALAWGLRPTDAAPPHSLTGPPLAIKLRLFVRRRWVTLVFLLMANYQPLHRVLVAANIEPLNLLLCGLFTALLIRRRHYAAGVVLTVFALTKLAPVLILIPLVAIRRWRVVGACLAAFTVYGLVLLATGGWRWELPLYTEGLPRLGFRYQMLSMSIHRFLADIFNPAILQDAEGYKRLIFHINITAMLVYLAAVALWTRLKRRDPMLMLAWGCFMVLLFSPLVEVNHYVWCSGAVLLQLHAWREGRMRDGVLALCAVAWALVLNMEAIIEHGRRWSFGWPAYFPQTIAMLYVMTASGVAAFAKLPDGAEEKTS